MENSSDEVTQGGQRGTSFGLMMELKSVQLVRCRARARKEIYLLLLIAGPRSAVVGKDCSVAIWPRISFSKPLLAQFKNVYVAMTHVDVVRGAIYRWMAYDLTAIRKVRAIGQRLTRVAIKARFPVVNEPSETK